MRDLAVRGQRTESLRYEAAGWGVGELWAHGGSLVWHELPHPTRGTCPEEPPRTGPPRFSAAPRGEARRRAGSGGRLRPSHFQPNLDPVARGRQGRAGIGTFREIAERLTAHFAGVGVSFDDVVLDLSWCTPFQRSVVTVLRAVPRGETVTYGELAALAGHPGAQRAVGTFCAGNRFPIVVPCHRVVGADGIGGYGSLGVEYKQRLLRLEGAR